MAIVLKKKEAQPAEELTQRQQEVLDLVGLGSVKKPTGLVIRKKFCGLSNGEQIVVTNGMFPWIKTYQKGDTGRVVSSYPAPDTPFTDPKRDALYCVKLDAPRVEGKEEVILARWEIEGVQNAT